PARAVRRDAPARGDRPRAVLRPVDPAHGRAVRRARRAHPRPDEPGAAAHLRGHRRDRRVRHALDHRGGVPVRPGRAAVPAARPDPVDHAGRVPAAAVARRGDRARLRRDRPHAAPPAGRGGRLMEREAKLAGRRGPAGEARGERGTSDRAPEEQGRVSTGPRARRSEAETIERGSWLPWVSTPIVLLLVLAGWTMAVSVFGVSKFILPTPADVGEAVLRMLADPATWGHVLITLTEVALGFLAALAFGLVAGVVLGRAEWLERALRPVLVAVQVVPKVAFIPLFVIWFGFGVTRKIIMAATLAFFPIMLNVMLGVRSVERGHRDVMLGLGARRGPTFRDLELPSTLPYVLAGMEDAVVCSVIGAVVGEFLGGSEGLGYLVVVSLNALDAPQLFAVIFLLAALGCLLYLVVNGAKRFVIPWHESVLAADRP